jgi:hypothetical protein
MVGIRLIGLADEFTADRKRPMANRIKDPHGNTTNEMKGEFAIGADSARPDFLTGVILPIGLRFDAAEEGSYAIEFEFDEAWTSLPVHVVHGLPAGLP